MKTWPRPDKGAYAARLRPAGAPTLFRGTQAGEQTPAAQLRPTPQSMPQPPQCFGSVFGFTQPPPHKSCGLVQVGATQVFPLHTLPPLQSVSTQHSKQPVEQHNVPLAQAEETHFPLPSQLFVVHGSESAQCAAEQHSRHSLPQSLGVEVAHWQLEPEQTAPGLQAELQAPQCSGSLVRSTSQPSAGWLLQLANPLRQEGCPLKHCWLVPTGWLQPPQCSGSLAVFTQEFPHLVSPLPQESTQDVPSQIGAEELHTVVHEPQCFGSVRAASQPGLESQSWKPARHPHFPAVQEPFTPQLPAHAPQFFASVARTASQPSFLSALQSP